MDCQKNQLLASRLLDDALAEGEEAEVFRHLAECDQCREFLRLSIKVKRNLAGTVRTAMSVEMDQALQRTSSKQAFALQSSSISTAVRGQSIGAFTRTFALALLVVIIGALMFSTTLAINRPGSGGAETSSVSIPAFGN